MSNALYVMCVHQAVIIWKTICTSLDTNIDIFEKEKKKPISQKQVGNVPQKGTFVHDLGVADIFLLPLSIFAYR